MAQSELDALAQKQRASDILSGKLPSVRDPNAPEKTPGSADDSDEGSTAEAGDPARPMRPPQPIRPDRYTPGQAPSAETLSPGAAPPGLHRETSAEASTPAVTHSSKPDATASGASGAGADRVVAPTSRFPPKSATAAASTGNATTAGSATNTAVRPATSTNADGNAMSAVKPASKPSPGIGGAAAGPAAVGSVGQIRSSSPSGQTGQASTAAPTHRTVIPAESADGILTPAGMGSIGSTPRPKAVSAARASSTGAAGNGTASTGTGAESTVAPGAHPTTAVKPATAKPQTTPGPQTQNPSPKQPATAPPGGA